MKQEEPEKIPPGAAQLRKSGNPDTEPQIDTANIPKPEIRKMEVHHHPHTEKKSFREYLLEGLMIFIAVSMGFLAESIRESINEKTNAAEFLESYRNELFQQQGQIEKYQEIFKTKLIDCDSIITIYYRGEENKKLNLLERLIIPAKTIVDLPIITSAYDQMVNSGTLRYIKNPPLREKMASYKFRIEDIQNFNSHIIAALLNMAPEGGKMEDLHDFVAVDSTYSFDSKHIPQMNAFAPMTSEQRRFLINYYVGYKVQAASDLSVLHQLSIANSTLIDMVNKELAK